MNLSKERQKKTGAFYTPKIWADLAVKYILEVVPNIEDYVFLDVCCGEGALLEALPKGVEKYGTTLEWEDVEICRNKGFQVWQLDFLKEDISEILPESKMKKLIIFTNPPYVKLPVGDNIFQIKHCSNDATALFYYRILNELKPILLCGFNKLDLYQASIHQRFRYETKIREKTIKQFLSPSKSWNLNGDFPISFNILQCL
jgi:hypothetical protein